MVIYVVIMDEVMEFVFIKIKRHYHVCALSMNSIYVMYKVLCEFQISMLFLSKLTPKEAKRFKTNKFFERRDVTSRFS